MLSGCEDRPIDTHIESMEHDTYREMAEEIGLRSLRVRHFRLFYLQEIVFDEEFERFEVFAICLDGEMERSVIVYFRDGETFVHHTYIDPNLPTRRTPTP